MLQLVISGVGLVDVRPSFKLIFNTGSQFSDTARKNMAAKSLIMRNFAFED